MSSADSSWTYKVRLRIFKFIALATCIFICHSARAATGEELFRQCSDPMKEKACKAYINGVADGVTTFTVTVQLLHPKDPSYPRLFCTEAVAPEELVRATRKYLANHPETRHFGAASQVMLALQQAFPCRNQ